LDAHWRSRQDYSRSIWNLLMFSLWHQQYVSASVSSKARLADVAH
jgi:hypothetical protein